MILRFPAHWTRSLDVRHADFSDSDRTGEFATSSARANHDALDSPAASLFGAASVSLGGALRILGVSIQPPRDHELAADSIIRSNGLERNGDGAPGRSGGLGPVGHDPAGESRRPVCQGEMGRIRAVRYAGDFAFGKIESDEREISLLFDVLGNGGTIRQGPAKPAQPPRPAPFEVVPPAPASSTAPSSKAVSAWPTRSRISCDQRLRSCKRCSHCPEDRWSSPRFPTCCSSLSRTDSAGGPPTTHSKEHSLRNRWKQQPPSLAEFPAATPYDSRLPVFSRQHQMAVGAGSGRNRSNPDLLGRLRPLDVVADQIHTGLGSGGANGERCGCDALGRRDARSDSRRMRRSGERHGVSLPSGDRSRASEVSAGSRRAAPETALNPQISGPGRHP